MAVKVDDIVLVGNNTSEISSIKAYLDYVFKIKDLGDLHYFLGLEFNKIPSAMVVSQWKYTLELLAEFKCLDLSSVVSLLDITSKLYSDQGDPYPDPFQYRKLVGKPNFLTHTRPDLSFSVQHFNQFMSSPR